MRCDQIGTGRGSSDGTNCLTERKGIPLLFINHRLYPEKFNVEMLKTKQEGAYNSYVSGIKCLREGNVKEAAKKFDEAIDQGFNKAEVVNLLAKIFRELGREDKELEYLEKAAKIDSENEDMHSDLGDAYLRRKDYRKAIESYETVLKYNEESTYLLNRCGRAYATEGRYVASALSRFGKSLELDPNQPEVHLERAKIYMRMPHTITVGDPAGTANYESAKAELEKALELDPDCKGARPLLKEVSQKIDDGNDSQYYDMRDDR